MFIRGEKIDQLYFFPSVDYLTFISQELLALKEAKHYHFSFHIGIFNAASMWGFFFFLHYMKLLLFGSMCYT